MNDVDVSLSSISSAVGRGCVSIKGRQICLFRVHIPVYVQYSASGICVFVMSVVSTSMSVLLTND